MSAESAFAESVHRFCDEYLESNYPKEVHKEIWCIKNFFKSVQAHKEFFKSPSYYAGPQKELKYCLHLYPKGDASVPAYKFLSIHPVLIENKSVKRIRASFQISVTHDSMKHFKKSFFVYRKAKQLGTLPTLPEFANLDDLRRLICHNLYIHCIVNMSNVEEYLHPEYVMRQLSEDLESLFRDQTHSDVTLVLKDRKFQAHKSILASRSQVFEAMFHHDMTEKKNNMVDIADTDSDVFEEFLLFLYSGRSKFLVEANFDFRVVCDLLSTADKYDVITLKKTCVDRLEGHLTVDNACEILSVADFYGIGNLKKSAIAFINSNASSVVRTSGWEELLNTSSIRLLADLYVSKV